MIFTVAWVPVAEDELTELWIAGPDRAAITAAANQIDAKLRHDPYADSESREGADRIMFVTPLAVAYEVSDDDCLVTVTAVWRID